MTRFSADRNRSATLLPFLVLLAFSCTRFPSTEPVTLTFKSDSATYTVSFDPSKISERQVRELIILSPYVGSDTHAFSRNDILAGTARGNGTIDKSFLALPLELCTKDDPAYVPCGQRDIRAPNFLKNAQVNLQKTRNGLAWLQHLSYPEELEPVAEFLQAGLLSSLWVQETRFKYYTSWDEKILKEAHEGLEPALACKEIFEKLASVRTKIEEYGVVRHDWSNCVNHASKNRLGHYPIAAWNSFLKAYGMTERYKDIGPD